MHTLLGSSSLLLTLLGAGFLLMVLARVSDWSQRRRFQLVILTMPLVALGLGVDGLHHLLSHFCLLRFPI